MSTLRLDTIQDQAGNNASTPNEIYSGRAKAWVNFDGTFGTSPFTTANGGIRAAFNVSSVTDLATGSYTVNFTNSLPDSDFVAGVEVGSLGRLTWTGAGNNTTTQADIRTTNTTPAYTDTEDIHVTIFR